MSSGTAAAEGLVAFVRAKPHVRLVLSGRTSVAIGERAYRALVPRCASRGSPEQRILEAGWVTAPHGVGQRLGVGDDTRVCVRRRLFLVNDEPVALCDSYYPAELAEGTALAEAENIEGGAYDADGEAVEVQETVAAADKHELRYEVKMR